MADGLAVVKEEPLETKSAGMSRNYFCVDCKCTTRNPRLYLEHRRDFHKEPISIHECEFCVYASRHSQKLARHLRTVHRDVIRDNINMQSGKSTSLNQSTEAIPDGFQQIQTGKNTRLSTCKLCGLYTVSKTVLMEHIRAQHPDVRIYECDQCDYTHYIRDRYNRHHRYHSMNQIRCKMCEFQTIYRWNLERHMRHHIDSVSLGFRCKKCNFTVSTKQSITAHEIAHHSGIPIDGNITIKSELTQVIEKPNELIEEKSLQLENENENNTNDNNDAVADNKDVVEDNKSEEENEFDASAFLEVIMDDDSQQQQPQTECNSSQFNVPIAKQEVHSTEISEWRNSSKSKYFFCINCSFRNEVNWSDGIADINPIVQFCPPLKIESSSAQNSLYRCGYCHQTSNWKHVIERHCRLVHNTPAFIEKFSDVNKQFIPFTPTKRRTDFLTEAATVMKKKIKDENGEETNF